MTTKRIAIAIAFLSAICMLAAPARAQSVFLSSTSRIVGANPYSVAIADFNADSRKDIVLTNYADGTISIMLGNGDGTFQSTVTRSTGGTGTNPVFVTTADLNGDNRPDIVVANNGSTGNNIAIFMNAGNGTFPATPTRVIASGGFSPRAIAIADFNGDNFMDLAVTRCAEAACTTTASVAVMFGNGNGTFQTPLVYSAGGINPYSIAAGNFNGDTRPDLAVANYGSNNIGVLLNNGAGAFIAPVTYSSGGNAPTGIAVADLNNDTRMDLAVSNDQGNSVAVLFGNANGTFQGAVAYANRGRPWGVVAADFTGDNRPELAVVNSTSSSIEVFTNNGTGNFGTTSTSWGSGGSTPLSLASADFNGDGFMDIVVPNYGDNNVNLLLGNGNGTFRTARDYRAFGYSPTAIDTGDFNGDGRTDVVTADYGNSVVSVYLGNGNGTLQTASTFSSVGTNPHAVKVADLNKDNRQDIIVGSNGASNGIIAIFFGNGNGTFQSPVTYNTGGTTPGSIVVFDFNGDGRLDIAVANAGNGLLGVLFQNANGTFAAPVTYPTGGTSELNMVEGDFNGDGRADLAISNECGSDCSIVGNIGILLGAANGTFGTVSTISSGGARPSNIAIGDLNGDTRPDLVATNAEGNVGVLLGNANGTFQSAVTYSTAGPGLRAVPAATLIKDFNGDGRMDVVVANFTSATLTLFLGNGNGTLGAATLYASGAANPVYLAAADFNGDSQLDIASADRGSDGVGISLNIAKNATAIAVTTSGTPSTGGNNVTFTATVTDSIAAIPTGTVTFYDGLTPLGTGNLNAGNPEPRDLHHQFSRSAGRIALVPFILETLNLAAALRPRLLRW